MSKNIKQTQAGSFAVVPVSLKVNSDVSFIAESGTYTIGMGDYASAAKYEWRTAVCPVEWTLEEASENQDKSAIIRLIESKLGNAKASLTSQVNTAFFTGQNTSNLPHGVRTLFSSGDHAGIAVSSFANWAAYMSVTATVMSATAMDALVDAVTYANGEPDVIVMTQALHRKLVDLSRNALAFVNIGDSNLGTTQRTVFRNSVVTWDRDLNATALSNVLDNTVIAINSRGIHYIANKGLDFQAMEPKRTDNALKTHQEIVVRYAWGLSDRRSQGRMTQVTTS